MKQRINQIPKKQILLGPPYLTGDEVKAVVGVIKSGQLSLGEQVEKFEKEVARFVGARYGVATSSGTTALHLAVKVAGIGYGDEVITTPFSFVASTNCFLYEGATPKFVDIDPDSFNLDPKKIEAAVTRKTRAILGVDIFGYPAEWKKIAQIAKKHRLKIIDDAAEALGAVYRGKSLGSLGWPTVFAFYPNKQMTTGEGGMVVTNSKAEFIKFKSLVNQGRAGDMQWLKHPSLGYNYRMTEVAAAMGRAQLKKLKQFLASRRQVAVWYGQRLAKVPGVNLIKANDKQHVRSWFIYVIRLDKKLNRDRVIKKLLAAGVPAKAYLPSIHLQPYMRRFGYKRGDFPVSEAVSASTLSLPFYTGMEEAVVDRVCEKLKKVIGKL
ncbi:MAG: hypothetical protein UX85_C0006G0021 [Candidatus Beckwithbacteria bacterium GW2011_GWB1_47_15]|uniref:Polysaccharide biosynthesis protein n=1 Tax=Candidatus Beckwithbacteria bacterium GW2011_GWB1_47_15 TaxID=1618371 RepID=A0A0G1RUQ8_9BACT|nr:MAG: polysaccharide biosynthesis protein [Candidatus Beckwithbacteria bacterium GW2011_GWC1_49_16]KKU35688.1 MAG: hypothetical protein UX50_C0002G0115 [Candidatus Beckwithbacteria bacterium GW2011_GWA1_46_30]KKU60887.1 MAG: hypothetical protein UX85_C0006G0021 [Candidatus Beckwithbacteria bacterium GW2011_GWB1_47_15]KKU72247.1 MAG: hypothetical protein UX97_C0001G0117 [Candidatus Beckwithbacteria bacterium GW2011_GWA2_47_25]KKW04993.1 MAG: hypothetical protein UY37_C0001G0097 [Candidatus Bec